MNRFKTFRALSFTLAFGAAASMAAAGEFATLNQGDVAMEWQTQAANSGTSLTVTGPYDISLRYEFGADETPFFQIFDAEGYALPNGVYKWELRIAPALDSASREALADARSYGDDSYDIVLREQGKLSAEPMVENGTFTVRGGVIVNGDLEEAAGSGQGASTLRTQGLPAGDGTGNSLATNAQVYATDLIVQGSECIGIDCTSSESFSFDTLRLKENNLRINFTDTSSSASFPGNDWEIRINDSGNGGAEYFAVGDKTNNKTPFLVEANTPNNTLYVASEGRIGVGTSTPVVGIHHTDGNSPTLRLEQDGSDGFAPQTWDIAGNETNFFIRDVTGGSKLPFKIKPGAPDNSIFIAADGDIGLSTQNPGYALHVRGTDGDTALTIEEANTGAAASRTMLNVLNKGGIRLAMTDSSASGNQTWNMRNINAKFSLADQTADGTELELDADGNLTIQGTLTAGSGGNTFPDYVFEDGYNLLTLEEVASFIGENGHLPRIPSAATVEAQGGHDMTKLQLSLLEKVEELTLYTLDQHEALSTLTAENAELKARLAALEAAQQ